MLEVWEDGAGPVCHLTSLGHKNTWFSSALNDLGSQGQQLN